MSKSAIHRDAPNGCTSPLSFVIKSKSMNYLLLMVEQVQTVRRHCYVPSFPVNKYSQSRGISYKRPQLYSAQRRQDPTLHVLLPSVLDARTRSASSFGHFNPGECVLQQNRYVTDIILLNLTFVGPCSVICLYIKTNQMHNISNLFYFGTTLYMFRTVSPSIIRSLRLYIQHQVYVIQVLWLPASKQPQNRPKHVECCSKIK
jgi:hypothetical protein